MSSFIKDFDLLKIKSHTERQKHTQTQPIKMAIYTHTNNFLIRHHHRGNLRQSACQSMCLSKSTTFTLCLAVYSAYRGTLANRISLHIFFKSITKERAIHARQALEELIMIIMMQYTIL